MKKLAAFGLTMSLLLAATPGLASSIPMLEFPQLNGISADAVYRMADHPNSVFVFEAYRVACGGCNENAVNIKKLVEDFKDHPRVQILDLSMDSTRADFDLWLSRHAPSHPVVQDVNFKVFKALRSGSGVPQVFVVDCRGDLLGGLSGIWDADAADKVRRIIHAGLETDCANPAKRAEPSAL